MSRAARAGGAGLALALAWAASLVLVESAPADGVASPAPGGIAAVLIVVGVVLGAMMVVSALGLRRMAKERARAQATAETARRITQEARAAVAATCAASADTEGGAQHEA